VMRIQTTFYSVTSLYWHNIVFTLKARYDLNCVKSAVKLQPTFIGILYTCYLNIVIKLYHCILAASHSETD